MRDIKTERCTKKIVFGNVEGEVIRRCGFPNDCLSRELERGLALKHQEIATGYCIKKHKLNKNRPVAKDKSGLMERKSPFARRDLENFYINNNDISDERSNSEAID